MNKRVIGFCGLIGAGKTSAANHLVRAHGFTRVRFAGPLKDMLRALGLSDAEVDGALKEQPCELLGGKTPRWAMQSLGTEWGRNLIVGDLWIRAWVAACARVPDFSPGIVVDDVRFRNEADAVRHAGGILIRIHRPGLDVAAHASEQQPIVADMDIKNDRDVAALTGAVDYVLQPMLAA